jgi:predicted transcriptional regulator
MAKEFVGLRLPPEIIDKIDELAKKETRTRANMIEVLLQKELKVREEQEALAAREGKPKK